MEQVGKRIEEIVDFLGFAGEMAIATQHKVDALGDKIDRMVELEHERDLKWEAHITQLTESINQQQASLDVRITQLTESSRQQRASIERMAASIDSASARQENVLVEYQKTAQALIQLATAIV